MRSEDDLEPRLSPPWKQAVEDFLTSGFKEGDIISHDWFFQAFGLPLPTDDPMRPSELTRRELMFLSQFDPLRRTLLEDHQIDLVSERAVGYRWVVPAEQTETACKDGSKEFRKAMKRMARRLTNVNTSRLSMEQRKENINAISALVRLKEIARQSRRMERLMPPEDSEE